MLCTLFVIPFFFRLLSLSENRQPESARFSSMQIKNKQRGLIQHFLICACPLCAVGAGFKQRSAINTSDDMLCNTVRDTAF